MITILRIKEEVTKAEQLTEKDVVRAIIAFIDVSKLCVGRANELIPYLNEEGLYDYVHNLCDIEPAAIKKLLNSADLAGSQNKYVLAISYLLEAGKACTRRAYEMVRFLSPEETVRYVMEAK